MKMKPVLVTLVILVLYQPSFAESVAFSIHAGKVEGQEFQKDDFVVSVVAESIIGPSVFSLEAMMAGNPITGLPERTTLKSVNLVPRIIIGYHACRISAGIGGGIVEKESAMVSPQGYREEHRRRGVQLLGVGELRVAVENDMCISGRVMQLRTRFPGVEQGWSSARLYTVGFVMGFG